MGERSTETAAVFDPQAARERVSARPLSKSVAQQELGHAGLALTQQGASNVTREGETEFLTSSVQVQRIADVLHDVNESEDPLSDELADRVQRAVEQSYGLEAVVQKILDTPKTILRQLFPQIAEAGDTAETIIVLAAVAAAIVIVYKVWKSF